MAENSSVQCKKCFSANIPWSDCIKKPILETLAEHLMEEEKTHKVLSSYSGQKKVTCLWKLANKDFPSSKRVFSNHRTV